MAPKLTDFSSLEVLGYLEESLRRRRFRIPFSSYPQLDPLGSSYTALFFRAAIKNARTLYLYVIHPHFLGAFSRPVLVMPRFPVWPESLAHGGVMGQTDLRTAPDRSAGLSPNASRLPTSFRGVLWFPVPLALLSGFQLILKLNILPHVSAPFAKPVAACFPAPPDRGTGFSATSSQNPDSAG